MENKKNRWVIAIVVIAILALIGSCSGGDSDDRTCAWCNGTGYNGNGAKNVEEYVFRKTPCKHCGGDGIK